MAKKGLKEAKKDLIKELESVLTPDTSTSASNLKPREVAEKIASAIHEFVSQAKVDTVVNGGIVALAPSGASPIKNATGSGTLK